MVQMLRDAISDWLDDFWFGPWPLALLMGAAAFVLVLNFLSVG